MHALQPTEVLSTLTDAGVVLSLTSGYGLKAAPASNLDDVLRAFIREHKPMLVEYLQWLAANDSAMPASVPTMGELDQELLVRKLINIQYDGGLPQADAVEQAVAHSNYLIHHWKCPTCSATGQRRGQRCTTGMALWATYDVLASQTH